VRFKIDRRRHVNIRKACGERNSWATEERKSRFYQQCFVVNWKLTRS